MADTDDVRALIDDAPASAAGRRPRRRWPWVVLGVLIAVPLLLTLAGALTSPPHVKSVPVGRLIYLEADQPSEHTTLLRGLRVMGPDGKSRQIVHEDEAQDTDTGQREWITQPKASPDGQWLAYEKQAITLIEEKQAVDNQLWVVSLAAPDPKPRMLLDLTKQGLKQFVGLAWTPDSRFVVFLNDDIQCRVALANGRLTRSPLVGCPPLKMTPSQSATGSPTVSENGKIGYMAITGKGPFIITGPSEQYSGKGLNFGFNGRSYALVAQDLSDMVDRISISPTPEYGGDSWGVFWGWSVFGGRRITSLKWSPDGRYIGYTVSKPPFEDELFYLDTATKKCYQLPVRTGQAGWDWAP